MNVGSLQLNPELSVSQTGDINLNTLDSADPNFFNSIDVSQEHPQTLAKKLAKRKHGDRMTNRYKSEASFGSNSVRFGEKKVKVSQANHLRHSLDK